MELLKMFHLPDIAVDNVLCFGDDVFFAESFAITVFVGL